MAAFREAANGIPYVGAIVSAVFAGIEEEMFGTRAFGRGLSNALMSSSWSSYIG